jgi:hypothetical protein
MMRDVPLVPSAQIGGNVEKRGTAEAIGASPGRTSARGGAAGMIRHGRGRVVLSAAGLIAMALVAPERGRCRRRSTTASPIGSPDASAIDT